VLKILDVQSTAFQHSEIVHHDWTTASDYLYLQDGNRIGFFISPCHQMKEMEKEFEKK
jgi:hypothetical protein